MLTRLPIYILADDLTGSADAANYFRTKTRRVRVSFSPTTPWVFSLGTDVVQVFDSESRVLGVGAAWHRVNSAGNQLRQTLSNDFFLFKKIDSTLRGHIGIEIEALLTATKRRIAVVAPSFPANGRSVENGTLLVGGVPIKQTAFARDPRNPVTSNKVGDIVRQTTSLPVVEISGDVVARGSEAIANAIENVAYEQAIVVIDAKTDGDLAAVAQAIAQNMTVIPCGSAGLAKQLVAEWDCESLSGGTNGTKSTSTMNNASPFETADDSLQSVAFPEPKGSCNRVVIAVGSANPVAHDQLRYAQSALGAATVELKPVCLASAGRHDEEMNQAKRELALAANRPVIGVSLAAERAERDPSLPGTFEGDLAEAVVNGCNTWSADGEPSVGFVATGGDTALALCKAFRANAIWPEGEVVSGVPWSWIETENGRFPMITKAGGFGNIDALETATQFLLAKTTEI